MYYDALSSSLLNKIHRYNDNNAEKSSTDLVRRMLHLGH